MIAGLAQSDGIRWDANAGQP